MFKLIAGISLAALLVAAPDRKKPVTLSGCAREGTTPGTFLLMNVHEIVGGLEQAVPTDAEGRDVLFQLSSSKGFKDGQRVEVIGTLDMSNLEGGQSKVSTDSTKRLDTTTEITTDDMQVTVQTDTPQVRVSAPGAGETTRTKETERVVLRLKVKSVRAQGLCHETWTTFPAPKP